MDCFVGSHVTCTYFLLVWFVPLIEHLFKCQHFPLICTVSQPLVFAPSISHIIFLLSWHWCPEDEASNTVLFHPYFQRMCLIWEWHTFYYIFWFSALLIHNINLISCLQCAMNAHTHFIQPKLNPERISNDYYSWSQWPRQQLAKNVELLIIWSALFMFGPYSGGKYLLKCHVIASYFLSLLQNAAQALGLQLKI